jgi:hypothetical protein
MKSALVMMLAVSFLAYLDQASSSDVEPLKNVIVLPYETEESSDLRNADRVAFSARRAGMGAEVFGTGTAFNGFGSKYLHLKPKLESIAPDTLVVVSDGRDVLVNIHTDSAKDMNEKVISTFNELTKDYPHAVVFSAEAQCCVAGLHHAEPFDYFDAMTGKRVKRACIGGTEGCSGAEGSPDSWKALFKSLQEVRKASNSVDSFLNAGLFAGRVEDILNLINAIDIREDEDDQAVLSGYLFHDVKRIVLDYDQKLFGNLRWTEGDNGCVFEMDKEAEACTHKTYGTTPSFIHAPNKFFKCHNSLLRSLGKSQMVTSRGIQSARKLSGTSAPTYSPTSAPTYSPTSSPTFSPTYSPTSSPTYSPTETPTANPTEAPTAMPTRQPTITQVTIATATFKLQENITNETINAAAQNIQGVTQVGLTLEVTSSNAQQPCCGLLDITPQWLNCEDSNAQVTKSYDEWNTACNINRRRQLTARRLDPSARLSFTISTDGLTEQEVQEAVAEITELPEVEAIDEVTFQVEAQVEDLDEVLAEVTETFAQVSIEEVSIDAESYNEGEIANALNEIQEALDESNFDTAGLDVEVQTEGQTTETIVLCPTDERRYHDECMDCTELRTKAAEECNDNVNPGLMPSAYPEGCSPYLCTSTPTKAPTSSPTGAPTYVEDKTQCDSCESHGTDGTACLAAENIIGLKKCKMERRRCKAKSQNAGRGLIKMCVDRGEKTCLEPILCSNGKCKVKGGIKMCEWDACSSTCKPVEERLSFNPNYPISVTCSVVRNGKKRACGADERTLENFQVSAGSTVKEEYKVNVMDKYIIPLYEENSIDGQTCSSWQMFKYTNGRLSELKSCADINSFLDQKYLSSLQLLTFRKIRQTSEYKSILGTPRKRQYTWAKGLYESAAAEDADALTLQSELNDLAMEALVKENCQQNAALGCHWHEATKRCDGYLCVDGEVTRFPGGI